MWRIWILTHLLFLKCIHAQFGTYTFSLIGKPTNQSSVYSEGGRDGTSDKAVDGNSDSRFNEGSCMHTHPGEENPWWAVDMGSFVTLFSVDLTNRIDFFYRLDEFSIYGSNKTLNPYDDDEKQLCINFNGVFGKTVTRNFICKEPITARYLSLLRPHPIITLCEVGVHAVCPDGSYGEECRHKCSTNCKNPPCDKFTEYGECPEKDCKPGFRGSNCTEVCPDGRYGDWCGHKCSPNCKNPPCDRFTKNGVCPKKECNSGFKGNNCTEECPLGTHGDRCKLNCSPNCKNKCSKLTGYCIGGCNPGYSGNYCERDGTYTFTLIGKPTNQSSVYSEAGIHGTSDMAVDGNTDNKFSEGSCTHTLVGEENPWWGVDMGSFVTVFSVDLTNRLDCCLNRLNEFSIYGSNKTLNPQKDDDKQLCISFDGEFGDGGTRTFTCEEHITARYLSVLRSSPIVTLCEVGIRAVCPDGTYGVECRHNCSSNCKSPICDKFTSDGTCHNGGCKSGFKGNNCSEECPMGTYGEECTFNCSTNCRDECSQQTGHCNGGCSPGYTGDTCKTECTRNSFGQDCKRICYCKQGTCNHITGLGCSGGCEAGYQGETCSESLTACRDVSRDSSSSQIAVAAVVSCVVSALATLGISIIVFRMWHRKQMSQIKHTAYIKDLSNINSAVSMDNAGHSDYEIPLDNTSAVTTQAERKDITEYQELGEREVPSTPNSYQTIRV